MDYISQDNPQAATDLNDEFEMAAERACANSDRYKPGRIKGTREVVVRSHYILVYETTEEGVLRVYVFFMQPGTGHLSADGYFGGSRA